MRRSAWVAILAVLAGAAVVAALVLLSPDSPDEPAAPPPFPAGSRDLMAATVDAPARARGRLPAGFLGLSAEVPYANKLAGAAQTGPNVAARGLMGELARAGSGTPWLRVGGSSIEAAWWTRGDQPAPPGIRIGVDDAYFRRLGRFSRVTGARLVMALNLANRDPAVATGYARAARRALGGRVRGWELGNEPDSYAGTLRPRGYGFDAFVRDWSRRADVLRRTAGPLPLGGPSVCCAPAFTGRLREFVQRERRRLAFVSLHKYFGSACARAQPGTPSQATREQLLSEGSMARVTGELRESARIAADAGKPALVTETNSFACGGQPGVSDSFASALWAPEYLMRAWGAGVAGLGFHAFGRAYSPFDFTYDTRGWRATVRPLYYGMLLFSRATADRAAMVPIAADRLRTRTGSPTATFATRDRRGTLRVLVIAKGGRGGRATVRVPGSAASGRLTRLRAPGLGARAGTELAGQRVPDGSRDGRLAGRFAADRVRPRRSTYRFAMPAAGAALLEIPRRR